MLVHELVHAGQHSDPSRQVPPELLLVEELLVEGATEMVTHRLMTADHRRARQRGRSPYSAQDLSDVAYHPYVVLCSAVLQVAFLEGPPPNAVPQFCTAADPLGLVRTWVGGDDPADRAEVMSVLRDLAAKARQATASPEARAALRHEAMERLGAIRRRRGLTARETYNLDYFVAAARDRASAQRAESRASARANR